MQHETHPPDQAYRDLVTLRNRAIASVAHQGTLPAFVSNVLPSGLQQRLRRAIAGCETAYEVRMVFASVQEHQLVSSY
jgi:hypothetical protein